MHTTDIFDEELKQLCIQLQNISFINVPIIKNSKPVGMLSLVQSRPRKWTDAEVQLTIETAERTWAAVERAKAVEALRQSEEKYRSLFTSIDQGFALCELVRNKEGKGIDFSVLEVNPSYEKQAGLSMEMVLNKTILQAFPALDKWWVDTYAAVVDTQCPTVFEHYFEITHRWFAINAYPGEKDRFAVLFNDITERKLAEEKIKESETKFRTLIQDAPIATCLFTGREMTVEIANDKILSYWSKGKNVIGKTLADAVPELKGQPFIKILDEVFTTGKIYEGKNEVAQLEVNGVLGNYYFDYTYKPIRNVSGEVYGIVNMAVDITEQVIAGKKIVESNNKIQEFQKKYAASLEEKVHQRTFELSEANESLIRMNKELHAFAYISSHDLQEPLRKIQTFASRILEKEENLSPSGHDYFLRMQSSANRMQQLIEDLLAFSMVNSAKWKFEKTDLTIIIEEVKNDLKERMDEKHATMETGDMCKARVIPFQFRQLLQNLVSNSLKFSNPETPLNIQIKSSMVKESKLFKEQPFLFAMIGAICNG